VAGLVAGLVLCGKELNVGTANPSSGGEVNEELLQLANEIEGHSDNGSKSLICVFSCNNFAQHHLADCNLFNLSQVAPAIYGGIQLCYSLETSSTAVMSRRIPCPYGMRLVVYVPCPAVRFSLGNDKTGAMRSLLGPTVTRAEAVFNIQRTVGQLSAVILAVGFTL
jgi:homoserine kinase